jgi:hypothetical protein
MVNPTPLFKTSLESSFKSLKHVCFVRDFYTTLNIEIWDKCTKGSALVSLPINCITYTTSVSRRQGRQKIIPQKIAE